MTTEQTQGQPETRPSEVRSDALLDACARALEATLREEICDSWHYSDHGDYAGFDDLPRDLKDAVTKAAKAVLCVASNAEGPGYAAKRGNPDPLVGSLDSGDK